MSASPRSRCPNTTDSAKSYRGKNHSPALAVGPCPKRSTASLPLLDSVLAEEEMSRVEQSVTRDHV
jgi:hypothetical protein